MYKYGQPGAVPDRIFLTSGRPEIEPPGPLVVSGRRPVHLLRRLAAVAYDSLLLVAVLFLAGLPLPLIPETVRFQPWARYAIFGYMVLVSFLFFGWFWTHGGQTLGMRAWRFRVVAVDGGCLSWPLAWRRFAWAMVSWLTAGAGFLWSLFDPQRRAWHDRLSATRLEITRPSSLAAQKQHADAQEEQRR